MLAPRQHEVRRRRGEGERRVTRGERLLILPVGDSRRGAARVEHRPAGRPTTRRDRAGPPARAPARAGGRTTASRRRPTGACAELREREGHQVTLSRRHVLSLAPATPCGFATAPLTCTLPFPIKRPGGPVSTETLQHVALFEKCRTFLPKAREVQAAGLHAWYKPISRSEDTVVVIEGKERIMMGSNNYLGLTHHPDVLAAAKAALDRYGSGCTGSRLLNGTLDLHVQLEAELAEFFGKKACVALSTGLQANLGVVAGLVGRGDLVFP